MFSVGQHLRFSEWLQMELDKRGWSQSDCARSASLNRAVIFKSIQSPQRKATAVILLKALVAEEENERRNDGKGKR